MKRLTIQLTVALIAFVIGVGATSVVLIRRSRPTQVSQPATAPPLAGVPRPASSADPKGVEIPGLSRSVVNRRRQKYKPQEFRNIYVTTLGTKGSVLATFALRGRREDGEVATGEPRQLGVHSITRYDVDGQPFCYQVLGNIPNVGALVSYDYYDDDGDGKFDRCVRGTWPRTPSFPAWVLSK